MQAYKNKLSEGSFEKVLEMKQQTKNFKNESSTIHFLILLVITFVGLSFPDLFELKFIPNAFAQTESFKYKNNKKDTFPKDS